MATAGQDVRGRTSSDFVDETILEAFVPAASQVNVQELLEAWDGEVLEDKNTIVPFIEQRQFLLLGTLTLFQVPRTCTYTLTRRRSSSAHSSPNKALG
jgi:hypothetical protein